MISLVILARNAGNELPRLLTSLRRISMLPGSEILLMNDGSEDSTVSIAQQAGCRVINRAVDGDFASQRNTAMDLCKNKYILFTDSDEEIPEELAAEIVGTIRALESSSQKRKSDCGYAYRIKRIDVWNGKQLRYGEVAEVAQNGLIRLVTKNSGKWNGKVHETFLPDRDTREFRFRNHLLHYPHQSLSDFILEVNHYSTLRAQELRANGIRASVIEAIAVPFGKFLYTFGFKRGFLDGNEGFIYSFLMMFHSFLVRAKLITYQLKDSSSA